MAFELVCQQCGVIGELEDPIDEFECPVCKGKMVPVKPHSPVETGHEDNTPTIAISRSQIQEYRSVKVAKTADFGFGGVVNAKLSSATRGIPVANTNTAPSGHVISKPIAAVPKAAAPIIPIAVAAVKPRPELSEANSKHELPLPSESQPKDEVKTELPPAVELSKEITPAVENKENSPLPEIQVQTEPALPPADLKHELPEADLKHELPAAVEVISHVAPTPEPEKTPESTENRLSPETENQSKSAVNEEEKPMIRETAVSAEKTVESTEKKEDISPAEQKTVEKKTAKTPVKKGLGAKSASVKSSAPKKKAPDTDGSSKSVEKKIRGTGKFEVVKGKGGVLQVFAPNGIQLSEADSKTYLAIRKKKHNQIVAIAVGITLLVTGIVCGIILMINSAKSTEIQTKIEAKAAFESEWTREISPKVNPLISGSKDLGSNAAYKQLTEALNAYIKKWENNNDARVKSKIKQAQSLLEAAKRNKAAQGSNWE